MSTLGQPRPVDPSRRRRARLARAALLALPLVELALLIAVGKAIGGLATFALLVAGAVAGVVVLRRVGTVLARGLTGAPGAAPSPDSSPASSPDAAVGGPLTGRPVGPRPGAPAATVLLVPAGVLLVIPGFLSDAAGLALLIPAVRRALAARLGGAVIGRLSRMDRRNLQVVTGQVVTGQVVEEGPVRAEPVHVTAVLVDPAAPAAVDGPEAGPIRS